MMTNLDAKSIDAYVGRRLSERRKMMGLSQSELGSTLHVTFQQIQKYEKGVNRISAGKLFKFANLLKVDVSYFYEGLDQHGKNMPTEADMLDYRLLSSVTKIENTKTKNYIVKLIDSLSENN